MAAISVHFHGALVELLPRSRAAQPLVVPWTRRASIKDLIESLGVPHTEVGRVLVGGAESDLSALAREGDVIDVFPSRPDGPEPAAEEETGATGEGPDEGPRFVLDVHLGKLARLLRLLGFDALYRNDWDDPELARIADADRRILLTRDRQLLKRRRVRQGYCVRGDDPTGQAREVLDRFSLGPRVRTWSRCLACNGRIVPVAKEHVLERLEPKAKLYYTRFYQCVDCGRIYWEGSHYAALERVLRGLIQRS